MAGQQPLELLIEVRILAGQPFFAKDMNRIIGICAIIVLTEIASLYFFK